ncbi:MAG TPA: transglycosylase family protein [Mycobacterium sp.]|nr:transglycosylase family protein [Mycobacterium sp.]
MAGGVLALLGPSAAVANADSVDWDAIAACESGGNWGADTGNGMYGGLQFKPATWKEFGGTGSPATASRAEQIAVANRVLAAQGPGAWPKCGPGKIRGPKQTPQTTGTQHAVRDLIKTLWSSLPNQ